MIFEPYNHFIPTPVPLFLLIKVTGVFAEIYEVMELSKITDGLAVPDKVSIEIACICIALAEDIVFHDNQDIDLQNEYYNNESHPKVEGDKFKSLRFQFQVPQSTYATMVFRELTKQSSSFSNQMTMTEKIL